MKLLMVLIGIVLTALLIFGAGCWVLTQPLLSTPTPSPLGTPIDPQRLEAHVREISLNLAPRDHTHPEVLDRVASYISSQLASMGAQTVEQPFDNGRFRNITTSFGPDSNERVVVGAHYDTAGEQPGADDNASGVAGLLELARALSDSPLDRRVELVAYSLEEPPNFRTPMMGSAVHAASLKEAGVEVIAMLSLEMLGFYTDEPGSQRFPSVLLKPLYPSTGNFITVVGRLGEGDLVRSIKAAMRGTNDMPVASINGPTWIPGIDFSDHLNYWAHGYRAAMITDTAFMRNDFYHTTADTPDTLDYNRMAKVVQQVHAAVLHLQAHGVE